MSTNEFEYTNDIRAALQRKGVAGAWPLLIAIAVLLLATGFWAHKANITQTAVGEGQVIPSTQVQVVENLEPGIVRQIIVSEGDFVEQGELLARLDETNTSSRLGELEQKQTAFEAELARLEAQAGFDPVLEIPDHQSAETTQAYLQQQEVLDAELGKLDQQLRIRQQQLEQKRQALEEARATIRKQTASYNLVSRELELTANLFKRRAVPEIEYLAIQRVAEDLKGDIEIMNSSILRMTAELGEAETLQDAERASFQAETLERKARVSAELSVIAESMKAATESVKRTQLRAPVSGIVNQLNIASLGEVVQSGSTIAEIVPQDDRLLIEARITPKDVAFVRPGLKARIRLSAYDYARYGTFDGTVERIGADTITDKNDETFYRVIVSTDENASIPDDVRIIPGMIATVDVEIGSRTILEYLMKPVLTIRETAFREPT